MMSASSLTRAAMVAFAITALMNDAARAAWTSKNTTDAMTDRVSVEVQTESVDPIPGTSVKSLLSIACTAGTPFVTIFTGQDIANASALQYRIDSHPAKTIYSADWRGFLMIEGNLAGALARELQAGDRFLVRVTPVSEPTFDLVFPISGLSAAISPIASACSW